MSQGTHEEIRDGSGDPPGGPGDPPGGPGWIGGPSGGPRRVKGPLGDPGRVGDLFWRAGTGTWTL